MFTIKSKQLMEWPHFAGFTLRKGDNTFISRKAVPPELWPKLERFRALELLSFEGEANAKDDPPVKLEELTEVQLFAMTKADLAELAKASGVNVEGDSKKALVDAMKVRCKPLPKLDPEPEADKDAVTVDPTGGGKVVISNKPRRGPAVPPVSVGSAGSE